MPLLQQIANTLYDGSYTVVGGDIAQINIGDEVNAVRPISNIGYVSLVWSGSFVVTNTFDAPGWWDGSLGKSLWALGWYEILYGVTVMSRHPIDDIAVGTPKVNGVSDGASTVRPGDTFVAGSGATISSVNIASDRPYRGDAIRYFIPRGCSAIFYLAVNTGFVDNAGNTNRYIIHP